MKYKKELLELLSRVEEMFEESLHFAYSHVTDEMRCLLNEEVED